MGGKSARSTEPFKELRALARQGFTVIVAEGGMHAPQPRGRQRCGETSEHLINSEMQSQHRKLYMGLYWLQTSSVSRKSFEKVYGQIVLKKQGLKNEMKFFGIL